MNWGTWAINTTRCVTFPSVLVCELIDFLFFFNSLLCSLRVNKVGRYKCRYKFKLFLHRFRGILTILRDTFICIHSFLTGKIYYTLKYLFTPKDSVQYPCTYVCPNKFPISAKYFESSLRAHTSRGKPPSFGRNWFLGVRRQLWETFCVIVILVSDIWPNYEELCTSIGFSQFSP